MLKSLAIVSAILGCGLASIHNAQNGLATPDDTSRLRVIVASPDKVSDSVISVPPDTSWTGSISFGTASPSKTVDAGSAANWIHDQSTLNGLQAMDQHPWHIVIAYEQFDEDGDNVHSGTVEEYWAGPKKYKITYKSDTLNQTDYATDQGLSRLGDQRWPNRTEEQVRTEVVNPFSYLATTQAFRASTVERTFGAHSLHCAVFDKDKPGQISIPTQYCFDRDSSVLRYVRGEGWFQTVYNDIVQVGGRNVARDVAVTDGGRLFLNLKVTAVELVPTIDDKEFIPPADAVSLANKRVTGINPRPLQTSFPEWPSSLRQMHFVVVVEIVIGKDGCVIDAHAVSGPLDAYKAAEATARKWRFSPYLVVGEPTEVETKIQLQNQ